MDPIVASARAQTSKGYMLVASSAEHRPGERAALEWLEEETPGVALVDVPGDPEAPGLLRVLDERGVAVVQDGTAPMQRPPAS